MKKMTIAALAVIFSFGAINAQAPDLTGNNPEPAKPDLSGETLVEPADSVAFLIEEPVVNNPEETGYESLNFAGFNFELPVGMIVDNGKTFAAKYPDGTFGVSMNNQEVRGSNQKTALELTRKLAQELRLPATKVEKVRFGRCIGARASGQLEGQNVTIMVLPYNNQQVTTVMLCTPYRQDWADHFLTTLKR